MIRVLLADDENLIRTALATMLDLEDDIEIDRFDRLREGQARHEGDGGHGRLQQTDTVGLRLAHGTPRDNRNEDPRCTTGP